MVKKKAKKSLPPAFGKGQAGRAPPGIKKKSGKKGSY